MITKILFAGLCIATIFSSCTGTRTTKGIFTKVAYEERIQTATIVTNAGDTMLFILPIQVLTNQGKYVPGTLWKSSTVASTATAWKQKV